MAESLAPRGTFATLATLADRLALALARAVATLSPDPAEWRSPNL